MSVKENLYNYQKNQAVIDLIPVGTKKILDLGCGTGTIADFLDKTISIHGITISEKEYEISKTRLNKVFMFNLENGLPENIDTDYDLVIASHVLEHIACADKLLSGVKGVLKPDGAILVALPNIMHYTYRFKLIWGNFEYEDTGVMDRSHLRWYTYKSARKMLTDNGFYIIKSLVDSKLPLYRFLKYLPNLAQNFIKSVLYKISKGFFGMQLIYLAIRKKS
jgi:2-polyprenyl-3-methyl-5-hydroxy-6-metoxy-1,4-benzoquinol methylase